MIPRPRVVLKADLQSGSQDLPVQDARSFWESQQDAESYGKPEATLLSTEYPGSTGSARNHKNTRRSESHRSSNFARVLQNFNVLIAIRLRKSVSFIAVAGDILKYSRSPTTLQKTNRDSTSILGFAIEKNSSRGPKHSASERQIMFKAKEMLKKARQSEHDGHPSILSRWYAQEGYRRSLAEHNIGEKEVMLFDRIAFERHDFSSTRAERPQNAKHWVLRLNVDGRQKRLRQRQEFADASKQCRKNDRCSLGGNATISETDTSRTSTTSTTRSAIRRRRKLRFYVSSENWMAVLQRGRNPPAASSSSTSQWQTSWSSWYFTSSEKWR